MRDFRPVFGHKRRSKPFLHNLGR